MGIESIRRLVGPRVGSHQHSDAKNIDQDAISGDYAGDSLVGSPVDTHTPVSLTPVSLAGFIMVRCGVPGEPGHSSTS